MFGLRAAVKLNIERVHVTVYAGCVLLGTAKSHKA